MPVTDNQEDKDEECDYEQARGFSGIDRVPAVFRAGFARARFHAVIVRPKKTCDTTFPLDSPHPAV
jgi:hypothetical protein